MRVPPIPWQWINKQWMLEVSDETLEDAQDDPFGGPTSDDDINKLIETFKKKLSEMKALYLPPKS
jgi:hypothetical protein